MALVEALVTKGPEKKERDPALKSELESALGGEFGGPECGQEEVVLEESSPLPLEESSSALPLREKRKAPPI